MLIVFCCQANKELEVLKADNKKLSMEQEELQQRLSLLQSKLEEDGKRHKTTVAKLQAQLNEKTTRRKVSYRDWRCHFIVGYYHTKHLVSNVQYLKL